MLGAILAVIDAISTILPTIKELMTSLKTVPMQKETEGTKAANEEFMASLKAKMEENTKAIASLRTGQSKGSFDLGLSARPGRGMNLPADYGWNPIMTLPGMMQRPVAGAEAPMPIMLDRLGKGFPFSVSWN